MPFCWLQHLLQLLAYMTVAFIALLLLSIENTEAMIVNMSLFTSPRVNLNVNAMIAKGVTVVNSGATTDRGATTGVNSMIDC